MSIEMDGARAILSTYRDVHDTPQANASAQIVRSKLQQKNKNLESELNSLKEKYLILQRELINRDKKLATLNNQLIDKTIYMTRLQEDFENAIEQLGTKP
jgi:molecular chaperone GrpE (heat shock protein)